MRYQMTLASWLLPLAALLAAPHSSRAISFMTIPAIPGVAAAPEATAISADGQVVVGSQFLYPYSNYEGFRWTAAGGTVPLGESLGSLLGTYPQAVSADGSVVAGYTAGAGGAAAFRWTESGGLASIGTPAGTFYSIPRGVSGAGDVVVGTGYTENSDVLEAFRWTQAGGMVGIGDLPGGSFASEATGVSADGSVVVGRGTGVRPGDPSSVYFQAFRWTEADGMIGLGSLAGFYSRANAVSADGSAVVGRSQATQGDEAFLWTETGGMSGLGDLLGGSFSSEALAVSGDGFVVVGESSGTNIFQGPTGTQFAAPEAFVWDPVHGMRSLQKLLESAGIDVPYDLHRAIGVSADGTTILGTSAVGIYPTLVPVSWIVTLPIPEPSTALLLLSGLLGLVGWRKGSPSNR